MNDHSLAVAADYADALLIARRVKNWLVSLLLLMLLGQIALFLVVRYSDVLQAAAPTTVAAETMAEAEPEPVVLDDPQASRPASHLVVQYALRLSTFLGLILSLLLAVVLFVLVQVMVVGRLIGLKHLTHALIGGSLLALLLFPWQAFVSSADFAAADFKIPGILYTWNELVTQARFDAAASDHPFLLSIIKWARFMVFPIIAIVLLGWVHARSTRGLRLALGEEQPPEPAEEA